MSISGVRGQMLEVTIVECTQLKDTDGVKRQESYVCIEYGSTKFRTRTCKDGGKNPVFQEKFMLTLIEELKEINVVVWNKNPISYDYFIGCTKVQLQDALSGGCIDRSWRLETKSGRYAGEVKLIMHYEQANKPTPSYTPYTPPPYTAKPTPQPQLHPYSLPPTATTSSYTNASYSYQHPNSAHQPPIPYSSHPKVAYSYPPPPSPNPSIHPPPLATYLVSPYAPPPYASSYSPPGFYGMYTQPPY